MRRIWLSAASSTSTIINDYIDCFQKTNRCCGYSNALDYCCSEQNMEVVPTYINEIEPIEDKIEELRLELEKQNVTRSMKEIRERNKNLELRLIDLKLVESAEKKLQSADYIDEVTGNFSTDNFLYYDELNDTESNPTIFYYESDDEENIGQSGLVRAGNSIMGIDEMASKLDDVFDDVGDIFDGHECEPEGIRYNSKQVKVLKFTNRHQILYSIKYKVYTIPKN